LETTLNKQQLINRIREERAAWEALLAGIDDESPDRPGAMGDWTFKDLVAHLTAWWRHELRKPEAALRGGQPGPAAWPEGLDTDGINEWVYRTNRDRPLRDVLEDSSTAWRQLEDYVTALPEQDLTDPGRFDWLDGQALGPVALNDFVGHLHDEHGQEIRDWRARLNES
jgi:hypothetical protein